MIVFDHVTVTYPDAERSALRDVDLRIDEGELCLVVGRTGSGKSTLLGLINGLVPHFTGGTVAGRVVVAGRDTREFPPRELADVVGVVRQDPLSGFVTDLVEEELAYGMESLGVPPDVMRRRVEEVLDLLGLAALRHRPLATLSAGQQQRVAIGAALTAHPQVLVLDEPTSALDPPAAEEVLAALQRLVHDLGLTVVLAEHRLERVVQYADRLLLVPAGDGPVTAGTPQEVMTTSPVAPPVVALGRLAGWSPLPLSIRDARRAARALRGQLAEAQPPLLPPVPPPLLPPVPRRSVPGGDQELAQVRGLMVAYGRRDDPVIALRGVDLRVDPGEVVALMGRNGAGKSTLLAALAGLRAPTAGTVTVAGRPPTGRPAREVVRDVGLVPQEPADLLWAETVDAECRQADRDADVPAGTTRGLLDDLVGGAVGGAVGGQVGGAVGGQVGGAVSGQMHPRDLSAGQLLALGLAVVTAGAPPLLLLDEPTRGLDYAAKAQLVAQVRRLADAGHAVVLATHDVELVAEVATRTVVLAEGDVVTDGPTRDVVVSSPAFAPQVAKILAPGPWLTVADVTAALERAG